MANRALVTNPDCLGEAEVTDCCRLHRAVGEDKWEGPWLLALEAENGMVAITESRTLVKLILGWRERSPVDVHLAWAYPVAGGPVRKHAEIPIRDRRY